MDTCIHKNSRTHTHKINGQHIQNKRARMYTHEINIHTLMHEHTYTNVCTHACNNTRTNAQHVYSPPQKAKKIKKNQNNNQRQLNTTIRSKIESITQAKQKVYTKNTKTNKTTPQNHKQPQNSTRNRPQKPFWTSI